jgi:hypothetical protein
MLQLGFDKGSIVNFVASSTITIEKETKSISNLLYHKQNGFQRYLFVLLSIDIVVFLVTKFSPMNKRLLNSKFLYNKKYLYSNELGR